MYELLVNPDAWDEHMKLKSAYVLENMALSIGDEGLTKEQISQKLRWALVAMQRLLSSKKKCLNDKNGTDRKRDATK